MHSLQPSDVVVAVDVTVVEAVEDSDVLCVALTVVVAVADRVVLCDVVADNVAVDEAVLERDAVAVEVAVVVGVVGLSHCTNCAGHVFSGKAVALNAPQNWVSTCWQGPDVGALQVAHW